MKLEGRDIQEAGGLAVHLQKFVQDAVIRETVDHATLKAINMARLLAAGEEDISAGRVRSSRSFFREFRNAHQQHSGD